MNDYEFIIRNKYYEQEKDLLHALGMDNAQMVEDKDMYDLLVMCGFFPSRAIAKKQWNRSDKHIPYGFTWFRNIGKLNGSIAIFNPIDSSKGYVKSAALLNKRDSIMYQE